MTDPIIKKRVTLHASGTPEYVGNIFTAQLPDGIPRNATIVAVEVDIREQTSYGRSPVIASSSLSFTLEWDA